MLIDVIQTVNLASNFRTGFLADEEHEYKILAPQLSVIRFTQSDDRFFTG